MDQIRFDFFGSVNGSNSRNSNANANAAEPSDAFAQILDQQLTKRADVANRRAADPRSRNDPSDRTDDPRPQVVKRRDNKTAAAKPTTAVARPIHQQKPVEKTASDSDKICAKPAAKPQQDDAEKTPEGAAAAQPTTGSTSSSGTTGETESDPQRPGDDTQQQNDGSPQQQQADDGAAPAEPAASEIDPSLLALLAVPLPLQTLTVDAGVTAEAAPAAPAGAGDPTAALQASLAASLAGAIDLTAPATSKAPAQPNTGGLKFGTILQANAGLNPKAADEAVAALQDAAEAIAQAADPMAQPAPTANGTKPQDGTTDQKAPAKTRDSGQAAATVTPELTAKPAGTVVQAMNRSSQVTWSGTGTVRNELSESMAVSAGSTATTDDAEFSNWSQFLGSGATGLGTSVSARQSAFLAQLKQNLQILPPHEQIAVQIRDAMQNGNSRVTMALHPAELGRVEVKLDIDKDKNVSATVIVDRPATLDLLRNDAKALERALQDAGLQTGSGSLSFNLRDSNGQNGGATQNGTGTGGGSGTSTGAGGSEVKGETLRPDVVATADGYVDLET